MNLFALPSQKHMYLGMCGGSESCKLADLRVVPIFYRLCMPPASEAGWRLGDGPRLVPGHTSSLPRLKGTWEYGASFARG